ncbi:MAG: fumarylacetoacetate hydrolase family protein [Bacteroidia bacterium]|nr:fumarylacetoacetate hydrolase family protein [Bacteroidia bacterium]
MHIFNTRSGILVRLENGDYLFSGAEWNEFINRDQLREQILDDVTQMKPITDADNRIKQGLLAPIGRQEVWAAGVTYFRSREARMEEAEAAGGGDFYDRVYYAQRPELFFKATPSRVAGPGTEVYIRHDSTWDVPEPELTLMISSSGKIVGYTIGNDMSSRSIEGENPLYLPQAKSYERCAGLGPCIYVPEQPLSRDTEVSIGILRQGKTVFSGDITLAQMKRTPEELAGWLFRECEFPDGCLLMTGTGIVPNTDFTLQVGDEVKITIGNIGTLVNIVGKKK